MYIDLKPIFDKYNIHPKGVIQVGAHWAEEHDDYLRWGIERFVYIEPCVDAVKIMKSKFGLDGVVGFYQEANRVRIYNFACGSENKEMPMYVSHQNQGQSNSLLRPELHLLQHPEVIFNDSEVVKVIPLDDLPIEKEKYSLLVMDVQGFEGEVLKGAEQTLKYIDIIYTEVNRGETYKGNMEIDEMDEFLWEEGFVRVETFWPSPSLTWGDAVYLRKSLI